MSSNETGDDINNVHDNVTAEALRTKGAVIFHLMQEIGSQVIADMAIIVDNQPAS